MSAVVVRRMCTVDDCERPHVARGFCDTHYGQARREGTIALLPKLRAQTCSVDGCKQTFHARGLCSMHYSRARYTSYSNRFTRTTAERLAERLVRMPNGCLEWQGYAVYGYGQIGLWADGKGSKKQTHRLAWELANGPIPDGLHVLHHCDNPPCAEVSHLFLGTPADNSADKIAKGRQGINAQREKTHCPRGHAYDEANTYRWRGRRNCRACHRKAATAKRLADKS